jgi:HSP20 family molecular chaperone IbpA
MVPLKTVHWRMNDTARPRFAASACPFIHGDGLREELLPVYDPCIEVRESLDSLVFVVDLPGLSLEHVEVLMADDLLVINGEREKEPMGDFDQVFLRARTYGTFSCSFPLPCGLDTAKATASMVDGALTVRIPKCHRDPPRRLAVTLGAVCGAPRSTPRPPAASCPPSPAPPRPRPS